MQLYYSQTSPFARKVAMLLKHTGLIDRCEMISTTFETDELRAQNPLGKIPALVNDDLALFESDLICEYLDDVWTLEGNLSLFNRGSQSYYLQQKAAATANGIIEAAVSTVMEQRRDTQHSAYWLERWQTAIEASLNSIELDQCGTLEKPNYATFCLASALGYLDFRHPSFDWRSANINIAEWHQDICQAGWYLDTAPPAA